MTRKNKLAIISTHPIQYNAPFFALLTETIKSEVKVFYTYSQHQSDSYDKDFGVNIKWDIPLLQGYDYKFIENTASKPGLNHFNGIQCPALIPEIKSWSATHVLVFGWNYQAHLKAMRHFKGKIPVAFRGDSTLLDERDGLKKLIRRFFLKWVYKHIDYALYVGQNNKDYYKTHGVNEKQLFFAPHAIDNERFEDNNNKQYIAKAKAWREKLNIKEEDITILFAGKLEDKKNPLLLLKAFYRLRSKYPQLQLIFLGSGNLENLLKREANNDKQIHILPFQNQTIMPIAYRLGNIFCLPSKGPGETWGLAINEAMICGKPVIASDKVGCAKDLVIQNKTGFVFKSDDNEDLMSVLENIINTSPSKINILGENAKELVSQNFSYTQIIEAISDFLNAKI